MEPGFLPSEIDTSRPHPARMYDFYLGGRDNYEVDREAAMALLRIAPETRAIAQENRAFLQRAVRYLAGECGIRQFIDIGTGVPAAGSVHEIAAEVTPGVRVAYVDNDPIVHVHANALLTRSGRTAIVLADLRDPQAILAHPALHGLIDLTQPVGLLLSAIMHFITDDDDPAGIIATLRDALPSGSYLALSHGTGDFHPAERVSRGVAVYDQATAPVTLRSHAQITTLFSGFGLIEPGLVQVPLWHPDRPPGDDLPKIAMYGGVGRKPTDAQ
jgi:hypothetical protein